MPAGADSRAFNLVASRAGSFNALYTFSAACDVTAIEAPGRAVTHNSSRSPPATPPAVLIRTASSTARCPVLGNMTRIGERSKMSSMRVPLSDPSSVIRAHPSARCKSRSEGRSLLTSGALDELNPSVRSQGDITSNIGFRRCGKFSSCRAR